MLDVIENTILEKLRGCETFKGYSIDPEPEDFKNYPFTSELGCLLVSYDSTSYSDPQTLNTITQDATYTFKIIAGLRYFKTNTLKESFPVLQAIKNVLTGVRISSGRLYPTKCQYIGKLDRTHYYSYTFEIKLKSIEADFRQGEAKQNPLHPQLRNERQALYRLSERQEQDSRIIQEATQPDNVYNLFTTPKKN